MVEKFYITTAIDYVNSSPHLGHAYEKICADVLARWNRLLGKKVFFLTGTDENAQKNAQAAKEKKIPVKEFVDRNSKIFEKLCKTLNLSHDYFIRTTEKKHIKASQDIFQRAYNNGDIYKGNYEGYYCTGCEAFKTEKDLVDGKCPEHNKKPEWLEEESYFFRLSKYENEIVKLLNSKDFILPDGYRKEMLARIKEEGLKDLSISRTKLDWGIPVPFDKKHLIYVWFDALINYVSGIDYPTGKYKEFWPADVHLIGKGINWFHSVIWPAMLISVNIPVPKTVLVHGYVNLFGKKMSKSGGKIIDPFELVENFGADPVRYFLIREIPFGQDGDFSEEALKDRLNNELANDLGNLVSRSLTMVEKYFDGKITKNKNKLKFDIDKIKKLMEKYKLTEALSEIWKYVQEINKYINKEKPWEIRDAPLSTRKREEVLYTVLDSLRIVSILLYAFIPETCEKISKQLNFEIKSLNDCKPNLLKEGKIKKGDILFKKIE